MIRLRPMTQADLPFLERLYASTREQELEQTPWNEEQKRQFIAFQFTAQHSHYQQHFADSEFNIVEIEGIPVGRLYLDRRKQEIRVIDIALLPEYRSQGFGSRLLGDLIAEAEHSAKALSIHVEQQNPAMRLYKRLGFRKISEYGIYDLMERPAAANHAN
ncbi:MAG: N-acetyltransferase family protein [Gammaproteobacteria bacterium]